MNIADKDHTSRLTLYNARRDDAGQYEFRVENEFGEETALVDVTVRTEPSKPRGPLKIDEVHATGCTARWAEPEDDGGSPVTHYVVEKMATSSGSWQACGRTDGGCTEIKVKGLVADKEYRLQVRRPTPLRSYNIYRASLCNLQVKAVNAEGESDPLPGVDSFIAENSFGAPGVPGLPEPIDWDHDRVLLVWDPPKHDGGSKITGYQVGDRRITFECCYRTFDFLPRLRFANGARTSTGRPPR